jgi:hypothetical protein
MPKTSWEISKGGQTCYVYLNDREVIAGSHWGSGHTDNAGSCTHEAFLAGEFHDVIRSDFDEDTLQEIVEAVKSQASAKERPSAKDA